MQARSRVAAKVGREIRVIVGVAEGGEKRERGREQGRESGTQESVTKSIIEATALDSTRAGDQSRSAMLAQVEGGISEKEASLGPVQAKRKEERT